MGYVIQLFDVMLTEFPELEQLISDFENYALLWDTAGAFLKVLPQWTDGPMNLLVAEEVLTNVEQWYRAAAKCAKLCVGLARLVAEDLKQKVKAFQVQSMCFFGRNSFYCMWSFEGSVYVSVVSL